MRERDRTMYTVAWVAIVAVATLYLIVQGSPGYAVALVVVNGAGVVGFLRATHPGGRGKPNLNIFFDDTAAPAPAPPPPPARSARAARPPAPAARSRADVIDLRSRDRAAPTVDEAVAAAAQAAHAPAEVTDDLAQHHVRLLQQVQVKLRDYQ